MDLDLPFFSYGFFRPGEISFLGIRDYVQTVKSKTIDGDLVLRDGITLFRDSDRHSVDGYLIEFLPGCSSLAYEFVDSLEPKKLFKWREMKVNGSFFNILVGVKPDKGSVNIRETGWKSIWEDPFFTSAIDVLDEMPNESFDFNLKPLFKLQMKYMLLWTIIERFTFLRYSFGGTPSYRNKQLANSTFFKEALKKYCHENRTIYRTDDPDVKTELNPDNPEKSLQYYYQVRSNITHRGKAVSRDHATVERSFNELFEITKYVLNMTKEECLNVKSTFRTT